MTTLENLRAAFSQRGALTNTVDDFLKSSFRSGQRITKQSAKDAFYKTSYLEKGNKNTWVLEIMNETIAAEENKSNNQNSVYQPVSQKKEPVLLSEVEYTSTKSKSNKLQPPESSMSGKSGNLGLQTGNPIVSKLASLGDVPQLNFNQPEVIVGPGIIASTIPSIANSKGYTFGGVASIFGSTINRSGMELRRTIVALNTGSTNLNLETSFVMSNSLDSSGRGEDKPGNNVSRKFIEGNFERNSVSIPAGEMRILDSRIHGANNGEMISGFIEEEQKKGFQLAVIYTDGPIPDNNIRKVLESTPLMARTENDPAPGVNGSLGRVSGVVPKSLILDSKSISARGTGSLEKEIPFLDKYRECVQLENSINESAKLSQGYGQTKSIQRVISNTSSMPLTIKVKIASPKPYTQIDPNALTLAQTFSTSWCKQSGEPVGRAESKYIEQYVGGSHQLTSMTIPPGETYVLETSYNIAADIYPFVPKLSIEAQNV